MHARGRTHCAPHTFVLAPGASGSRARAWRWCRRPGASPPGKLLYVEPHSGRHLGRLLAAGLQGAVVVSRGLPKRWHAQLKPCATSLEGATVSHRAAPRRAATGARPHLEALDGGALAAVVQAHHQDVDLPACRARQAGGGTGALAAHRGAPRSPGAAAAPRARRPGPPRAPRRAFLPPSPSSSSSFLKSDIYPPPRRRAPPGPRRPGARLCGERFAAGQTARSTASGAGPRGDVLLKSTSTPLRSDRQPPSYYALAKPPAI
jgi:hypothetical protein